jgi:hypothetical protein
MHDIAGPDVLVIAQIQAQEPLPRP